MILFRIGSRQHEQSATWASDARLLQQRLRVNLLQERQ